MERFGNTISTRGAVMALLLAATIAAPGAALAQTVAERAVTLAQAAVKTQILNQEVGGNLSTQFNADTRTVSPTTTSMRVRGTGTAMRDNMNGQARPFSYDVLVNTRTSTVSNAAYAWRGAWYADETTPIAVVNGLTGMYRLNTVRSDNTATIADRATSAMPATQRNGLRNIIMQRLQSPEMLAIERDGRTITMASSLAREVSFQADGQQQVEPVRQGQRITSSATLTGERLVVLTSGDRSIDYQVTFEPLEAGRTLRVTRRVNNEGLRQPVVATSIYDRTTDELAFDLFRGGRNTRANAGSATAAVAPGIPDGTMLVTSLNDALSTRQATNGDKFMLTVQSPSQYMGAVIEGHLTEVARSGRVTGRAEMSFDFDTIRLNGGRVEPFEGHLEGVRAANGDAVRIDNEGQVQDQASQTDRTVASSGIGAAIGAVIGAMTGGGRGAAIGAAVGAGAGAGSVFITGRNDLDLVVGTEFTIRTMAQ